MFRFSNRVWAFATVVALVAMASQIAVAQEEQGRRGRGGREGGPGGRGGFGGPVSMARLATIDKVQAELKLTDEQKEKIKKINDDALEETGKIFQSGERPDFEKMRKIRESSGTKLNEVLDEGQRKRLLGIFVQIGGVGAVNDPVVAKELNITDDQKTKLTEVREENMQAMRDAFEGGRGEGGSREEMRAKIEKLRDETNKKTLAVLTSEQQQKLESLKGEKVEIDMSELRGPGGRGDRPGRTRDRATRGVDQPSEKKSST